VISGARSPHANAYFGLRSTGNTGRSLAPDLGIDDLSGPLDADILALGGTVAVFDGRSGGASLSESESEESDVERDVEDVDEEDEEDDEAEEDDVDEEEVEESESESESLSSSDCLRDGPATGVAVLALTTGG
jgi:hypothetical protein